MDSREAASNLQERMRRDIAGPLPADRAREHLSARPKKYVQDAAVVRDAARLVRKERPDDSPFKVREFLQHDARPWLGA
jgi:hypothetical protein